MPSLAWSDLVGAVGVAAIVVTYFLLQVGKIKSDGLSYSVLNAVGAALILFSLTFKFNLSAFLIEFFWVIISIYGIAKYLRRPGASERQK